ncbi:MAG: putative metal-binding motif-containing protein [Myxococcota bacterium]
MGVIVTASAGCGDDAPGPCPVGLVRLGDACLMGCPPSECQCEDGLREVRDASGRLVGCEAEDGGVQDGGVPDGAVPDGAVPDAAPVDAPFCTSAAECADGDPCTEDLCVDGTRCDNPLIDGDGDGFAPASLGACLNPAQSGDCNDGDVDTFPGAPEVCDGVSQDCDAATDEGLPELICFRDQDGDGFPGADIRVSDCACPDGFTEERMDGRFDCADGEAEVFPGQTSYFPASYTTPGGPSFDYDCDGEEELRWPDAPRCINDPEDPVMCILLSAGWAAGNRPGCGETGNGFANGCSGFMGACAPLPTTGGTPTQECR